MHPIATTTSLPASLHLDPPSGHTPSELQFLLAALIALSSLVLDYPLYAVLLAGIFLLYGIRVGQPLATTSASVVSNSARSSPAALHYRRGRSPPGPATERPKHARRPGPTTPPKK